MNKNIMKKNGLKGMAAILAASAMMSLAVPAFAADSICESADMATAAEMQVERRDLVGSELNLFGETFYPIETKDGLVFPEASSMLGKFNYINYKDDSGNIMYRRYYTLTEWIKQYDIKEGDHYAFALDPESDEVHDGVVIAVFEEPGALFGTNRMCTYVDQQTWEVHTVGLGRWSWNTLFCFKVEFGELERYRSFR